MSERAVMDSNAGNGTVDAREEWPHRAPALKRSGTHVA